MDKYIIFFFLSIFCLSAKATDGCYIFLDKNVGNQCASPVEMRIYAADFYTKWLGKKFIPLRFDFFTGGMINVVIKSGNDERAATIWTDIKCEGLLNSAGRCEHKDELIERKNLGAASPADCMVSNLVLNPVNLAIGNKFQADVDVSETLGGLEFTRYYNSLTGKWGHSYSSRLILNNTNIGLALSDGSEILFFRAGNLATPETGEFGLLQREGDVWTYRSLKGKVYTFDVMGRLTSVEKFGSRRQNLVYANNSVTVIDSFGETLTFTQDEDYQPLTASALGHSLVYSYNASHQLLSVAKTISGSTKTRQYHYEISGKPNLLTGITDERGVRYATWSYDDQDRVISSEHASGSDRGSLTYNPDGSTTFTNELGKKATYRFQVIQGVKRIIAIEGEPSTNCPSSNSTFTYDDRGLLKSKTDKKGYITTYNYNDRGLEISRTEASGTAQARTTTTDWHSTLFLPETVTEPGHITHYQYDDQGRQLSQTIESF